MSKARNNFETAINLWLLPFLIGGSLAIGYEITSKALFKLESKNKLSHKLLEKEIVLTANVSNTKEITF